MITLQNEGGRIIIDVLSDEVSKLNISLTTCFTTLLCESHRAGVYRLRFTSLVNGTEPQEVTCMYFPAQKGEPLCPIYEVAKFYQKHLCGLEPLTFNLEGFRQITSLDGIVSFHVIGIIKKAGLLLL